MESVHRSGRIWGIAVACVLFAFPVALSLIFGTAPDFPVLLKGIFATAPMYWAVGAIEVITYVPMLGAGGAYLSFVTGTTYKVLSKDFIKKYGIDTSDYDVIKGWRADASYFYIAKARCLLFKQRQNQNKITLLKSIS